MNNFKEDLKKELIEAGAKDTEVEELISAGDRLLKLSAFKTSEDFRQKVLRRVTKEPFNKEKSSLPKWAIVPLITVVILFLGLTTVVSAQKSQPGETLYPLKLVSEDVFRKVDPDFKDEIIVRRSEEVKKLAEEKKDSKLLKKTLKEYKKEILRDEKSNKEKVEESRKNLEGIKEKVEEEDKKEIENMFKEIEDKMKDFKERRENRKTKEEKEDL